jgi:hypothetical protein
MCKGRIEKIEVTNKLPVIGKIKVGEKNEKGYPKSLDYFKPFGKYESLFYSAFPDKPNIIPIIFISDNLEDVCFERMELRNSKGDLFAKGDGKFFEVFNESKKEYEKFHIKDHIDILKRTSDKTGTKWMRVLTLRFLIPQIKGIMGLWQLETKADKSSIDQIINTFDYVMNNAGTVTRIMFDLAVIKHKSQKPNDPSAYPVISLIPNISESNLQLLKEFSESGKLNNVGYLNDSKILQLQENKPGLKEVATKEYQLAKRKEIDNPLFDYNT